MSYIVFDITEEELKNKNICNVIKGMAGTSKSSSIDKPLKNIFDEYRRYTSTHSLRRDAMARYPDVRCYTVAGGLFDTLKGCQWYAEIKNLEGVQCVVIDEVLQCNMERVIDFVKKYIGKIKIIICCDDRQMLVPGLGEHYLKLFNDFCKKPYVKVTQLTKTLRTTHDGKEDTKLTAVYNDAYENVDNDNINLYDKYINKFPHINYEDLIKKGYNSKDFYITYTNESEESLYLDFKIKELIDLEFIVKGNKASDDDADVTNIPIACQSQAQRLGLNSYLQVKNIGTITRMQGREVPTGHKCYIIVPEHLKMTNRAFYTAVTRCWSYDSIVFVDYKSPKTALLKKFMGENIKTWGIMDTQDNVKIKDGYISEDIIKKYTDHKDTEDTVWRRDCLIVKGNLCYIDAYNTGNAPKQKCTAKGIIKKSPELNFNCIDDVYAQIGHLFCQPLLMQNKGKNDFENQCDLFSAYPHIIAYGKLPIAGRVYNKPYEDKLNYYEVMSSEVVEEGSIITETLANLLTEYTNTKVEFVFGTDYTKGCKAGKELLEKAYKSKEDKADTKDVHWGLFQRPYLERVYISYTGEGQKDLWGNKHIEESHIVRDSKNVYEPLFCAIRSQLFYIMFSLKLKLYGRISPDDGFTLVDALYYDGDHTEEIKEFFTSDAVSDYHLDYRIYNNPKKDWHLKDEYITVYQSYENLKTRKQIDNHKYYERHKKNKK